MPAAMPRMAPHGCHEPATRTARDEISRFRQPIEIDFGPDSAHPYRDRNARSKPPAFHFQLASTGTHPGVRCPRSESRRTKGMRMQLPPILQGESLTRLLQGAAAGAAPILVVGFTWGGWVTGGTAKEMAQKSATSAVVTALAPICVDKFQHSAEFTANL